MPELPQRSRGRAERLPCAFLLLRYGLGAPQECGDCRSARLFFRKQAKQSFLIAVILRLEVAQQIEPLAETV